MNRIIPLRMNLVDELLGADYSVHNILHGGIGVERAVDILSKHHRDIAQGIQPTGNNLGELEGRIEFAKR